MKWISPLIGMWVTYLILIFYSIWMYVHFRQTLLIVPIALLSVIAIFIILPFSKDFLRKEDK